MQRHFHIRARPGHTLMELVVAMVASGVLLAGLGLVMMIGRQVAYTPSAAERRTETARVVNQIAEELRYATLVIEQTPQILEFVVADRDGDGTAERIRYEWSGTLGEPLYRTLNTATAVNILDSVAAFAASPQLTSKTTILKTTVDSPEAVLVSNTSLSNLADRTIEPFAQSAQQIDPTTFVGVPPNALAWNATKVEFYSKTDGGKNETLLVTLRPTGDPNGGPTSSTLSQAAVPEYTMNDNSWNTAIFSSPARGLGFNRIFAVVWAQAEASGKAGALKVNDSAAGGVLESEDAGASWNYMTSRQMSYRLYGTYTTPGPTYNLTRNYVSYVGLVLQATEQSHARIDASIPLANAPELLSAYWRADFSTDPTATNSNGDGVADWALAGGTFNDATLINGVWHADGALESRPASDFTLPTTIEVRCRNTMFGGNGAAIRINADRQGGLYGPLLVFVQRQSDGTQTLSLLGKPTDLTTKQLFTRARLSGDFIRVRLTILPQNDVVNIQINDEDQGTYTYPTCAPSTPTDRFITIYPSPPTNLSEFDSIDVRVATN